MQPNLQTPTVESYTFSIEQYLSPSTTLKVAYIGSHGYHEILSIDANVPFPTICPASPCPAGYPAGTWYNSSTAPLANPALSNSTHWYSEGVSSYNALEVDINHHFSSGLQFRGVYTYAKALDNGDSLNTSVATNSPAFAANPLEPSWDYGRGSFDIRNSAVINATYDLPFGEGKGLRAAPGRIGWREDGNSAPLRICNPDCRSRRNFPITLPTMVTAAIRCGRRGIPTSGAR